VDGNCVFGKFPDFFFFFFTWRGRMPHQFGLSPVYEIAAFE
jgi:hypothetical protein